MSEPTRHDDVVHRFVIDAAATRGALVRLSESWTAVKQAAQYPETVAAMLGEALAASALLGSHTKIDGRLSLQARGRGALRILLAEYRAPGLLRGLAHWQDPLPEALTPASFGQDALLAITLESPQPGEEEPTRYQGLVDLHASSLSLALERYFERSEQLPTRLLLRVRGDQAAGLLLQALPGMDADPDGFNRAGHFMDTVSDAELFGLPAETLLHRLFHEDGVRLLTEQSLRFSCTCSRERVAQMIEGIGEDEAFASLQDDVMEVICEFCNRRYRFDRIDLTQLFGHNLNASPQRSQ